MNEIDANIWKFYGKKNCRIVIPLSGKSRGGAKTVYCSRGLAAQANHKIPLFDKVAYRFLTDYGYCFRLLDLTYKLTGKKYALPLGLAFIASPRDNRASAKLIFDLLAGIKYYAEKFPPYKFYVPRLGCGHGGLQWRELRPYFERSFEYTPNVYVVHNSKRVVNRGRINA